MKKSLLLTLLLVTTTLFANGTKLEKGLYSTQACDVSINITNYTKDKHSYELLGLDKSYQGSLLYEKDRVKFDKLYLQLNPHLKNQAPPIPEEVAEAGDEAGEVIYDVEGKVKGKNYFVFHNYGEVMDPYILFEECDKALEYHKVEDLKAIEDDLKAKRNLDKYSLKFFYTLQEYFPINDESLRLYNDIAYYLYQAEKYEASISLLTDILARYPDRVVAHLNMADAFVAIKKEDEAKPYYLTYIAQMVKLGKEKKIPKELFVRYGDELDIIRTLERTFDRMYQIIDLASGDINQDKQEDRAVVITYVDQNKIEDQGFMKPSNMNERQLLLFLGTKEGYTLHTETEKAIFPDDVPNCEDSFNGIEIKKNSLYIAYRYWCSAGSWSQGEEIYQFLYRDDKVLLAGLESWNNSRASGEGKEISANFLTKKLSIQKTIEFDKPQGKPVWKTIKLDEPILLQDFSVNKVQSQLSELYD